MRPIFAGRDGIVKYRMSEIEQERRGGYAWYGNWGEAVLAEYKKWQGRADVKVGWAESSKPNI
jgi:hypothetical protein